MRILFLSDNFPPEVNAPASRTFEHCRQWARAGHEVTVLTCAPNFPRGKVFEGYRNAAWSIEELEGIRIIRVWSYITANEGFLRRVIDYLSFMMSAIVACPFVGKVDIIVATSPQFFTAVAGWVVGAIRRRPFVFELRDLWPESIKAVGAMNESLAYRMLAGLEHFLYRKAARIVSVTHSFRRTLMERGISGSKIDVVTNGVDLSRFSFREKDVELEQSLGLSGCFVAGYVGTHGMAHGLHTLLEAAEILRSRPDAGNIRLLLLGNGACKNELKETAKAKNLSNVLFFDSVSKEDVARWWSVLDVSIIHLKKEDLFASVIPSKLFECMGMGIPVLHGVAGESAEIVLRDRVGAVFESENAAELAEQLIECVKNPDQLRLWRRNCIVAVGQYDRTTLAMRMLDILVETSRRRG